jgi:hypothetical protein
VIHLMVAGDKWHNTTPKLSALHWRRRVRVGHAVLTEAGTKRRASLYLVRGEEAARAIAVDWKSSIPREPISQHGSCGVHTPTLAADRHLSGIGNAY